MSDVVSVKGKWFRDNSLYNCQQTMLIMSTFWQNMSTFNNSKSFWPICKSMTTLQKCQRNMSICRHVFYTSTIHLLVIKLRLLVRNICVKEPRGQFDPNLAELILGSRKFSTKLSWVFWIFYNEKACHFCYFFKSNIMKIFWQLFKSVYSWTTWEIITKVDTMHPFVERMQICTN